MALPATRMHETTPSAPQRMACFDVVRGFSVVSMVLFHLCYDLRYLYRLPLPFFQPPFQDIWRASISWVFLFVAGCMCALSRSNFRRSLRYLSAAAAIFVATSVAAVDTPISYGIIFCMGGSTLVYSLLQRAGLAPKGRRAACVLLALFLVLRGVPHGFVGLGALRITLPHTLYASRLLSGIGFPGPGFASGDYYPLVPFTLMYLTGASLGTTWHDTHYPRWCQHLHCAPLEAIGRHALPIYLLHQPLIMGVLQLLLG